MKYLIVLASVALVHGNALREVRDNLIETARIKTSEDLINSVISDCFEAESPVSCLKVKVLSFLDTQVGVTSESARAFQEDNIDKVIFERVGRVLNTNEFRFRMPEFFFQSAEVSYRADRGFDVEFPEEKSENGEARGLLKKKLLLPVLLLLKLKMKALMPLLVTIIGIKAVKALILSKLAITLVVGFLVYNLIMKKGAMPMMMPPADASPAPQYGPPAPQYGPPGPTPAPQDSYSPQQWEPSSSGPYARVWDASQLAYNSYYPGDSTSSAAANQSPSYSSVASISSQVSSSSSSPSF